MHIKHQAVLDSTRKHTKILEQFLLRYSDKLPEDVGNCYISADGASVLFQLEFHGENVRDQMLSLLGDTFGRRDWTAELEYRGRYFDWKKEVDGVSVTICDAQKVDKPEKFPVDPKQFPLQLTEGAV